MPRRAPTVVLTPEDRAELEHAMGGRLGGEGAPALSPLKMDSTPKEEHRHKP